MLTLKPFERIIAEHGPAVLRVCRALAGPRDAEDAWSETFLAALRAYPRLRPDSNIPAWLATIARRKAIDQRRARARDPIALDSLAQAAAPPDPRLAGRDDDSLWDALAALPDKQREAVALHYLAALPYLEVAAILGGTEAAARRAAADGIKTLRAHCRGKCS